MTIRDSTYKSFFMVRFLLIIEFSSEFRNGQDLKDKSEG
jgi:hypothetical protein